MFFLLDLAAELDLETIHAFYRQRDPQLRMAEWRIAHAEQVVGQQMGAIRDQENNQLNRKKKEQPFRRQLNR